MFILKSKQLLANETATREGHRERARSLHPKVPTVEFGEYEVTGSKGNTYTALCYLADGGKVVDCNCPSRVPCKHSAAALQAHVYIAARRSY